jgi:hypothetical protein
MLSGLMCCTDVGLPGARVSQYGIVGCGPRIVLVKAGQVIWKIPDVVWAWYAITRLGV